MPHSIFIVALWQRTTVTEPQDFAPRTHLYVPRIRFYGDGFGVSYVHPASLPKRRRHSRETRLRTCLWLTDGWWRTLWVCEDGRLGNLLGAFGLASEISSPRTVKLKAKVYEYCSICFIEVSSRLALRSLVIWSRLWKLFVLFARAGWAEWENLRRAQRLNHFLIFVWILKPLKALHGWKGLNWAPLKAFAVPVTCWRGLWDVSENVHAVWSVGHFVTCM